MSQSDHPSVLANGKARLGPDAYEMARMSLLRAFDDKIMATDVIEEYAQPASAPLADVAMLTLRQMQHDSPQNPIASWSLADQLAFVQAYFACDYPQALSQVDMEIDFSAQPELSDMVKAFHSYPIIKEVAQYRPTLIVSDGIE